jgi:hypothetical protein
MTIAKLIICSLLLSVPALAQGTGEAFLLDDSKPWAYLRLDHVGPRKPALPSEGPTGIWLRLVNNCRLPIKVFTFGSDVATQGVAVLDEVVSFEGGVTVSAGPPIDWAPPPDQHRPPVGYSKMVELYSVAEIPPGKDLLFSVPRDHVSNYWYMRVRFMLDLAGAHWEDSPSCYVDFFEDQIPKPSGDEDRGAPPPRSR